MNKIQLNDFVIAIKDCSYLYHPEEFFVLKDRKYRVIATDQIDIDFPESKELGFIILDESNEEHYFRDSYLDVNHLNYLFVIV